MTTHCTKTQNTLRAALLGISALALSACDSGQSQVLGASQSLNAIAGVQRAAQSQPSEADLSLSCASIAGELNSIYARLSEIDQAQRAVQRKRNIQKGMINTGISILGAGAIANAGSVNGIRNTSTAVGAAGMAANGVRANGSPEDGRALNEALALQERAANLERAKVGKGC
ncbi:hypothetical protein [uncultured Tateyamaria sp.]|uniref:hypothetical protein n=1 Tax=uncultured Tateyamaria sp. TaxID=455651 RepID=UPI00261A41C9|nr:hypothetical protein [uncultured Tateyamaria sp.]